MHIEKRTPTKGGVWLRRSRQMWKHRTMGEEKERMSVAWESPKARSSAFPLWPNISPDCY